MATTIPELAEVLTRHHGAVLDDLAALDPAETADIDGFLSCRPLGQAARYVYRTYLAASWKALGDPHADALAYRAPVRAGALYAALRQVVVTEAGLGPGMLGRFARGR